MMQDPLLVFLTVTAIVLYRSRLAGMKRKRTLHLKGFAYNLVCESVSEQALQFLREFRPMVIAWDGDALECGSFTCILKQYAQLLAKSNCDFKMFVPNKAEALERILRWKEVLGNSMQIIETDIEATGPLQTGENPNGRRSYSSNDYRDHGLAALHRTGAETVLVIGLGACIASEIDVLEKSGAQTMFYVLDVVREHKTKGEGSSKTYYKESVPQNVRFL